MRFLVSPPPPWKAQCSWSHKQYIRLLLQGHKLVQLQDQARNKEEILAISCASISVPNTTSSRKILFWTPCLCYFWVLEGSITWRFFENVPAGWLSMWNNTDGETNQGEHSEQFWIFRKHGIRVLKGNLERNNFKQSNIKFFWITERIQFLHQSNIMLLHYRHKIVSSVIEITAVNNLNKKRKNSGTEGKYTFS